MSAAQGLHGLLGLLAAGVHLYLLGAFHDVDRDFLTWYVAPLAVFAGIAGVWIVVRQRHQVP